MPGPTLGKFFFGFFYPIFCESFPHYLKLYVQIWDNFDFFLLYFVSFFVSLNFMEYFKFELQVHGIIEFGRSKNDILKSDHMWRYLGFRHPTSQLARNLLNFLP